MFLENMDAETPTDRFTFCNCGKKGCPSAVFVDGGVRLEAPTSELVTTSDGQGVFLDADAARELRRLLEERGF